MTNPFPSDAKALHAIIANNEEWLIDRILNGKNKYLTLFESLHSDDITQEKKADAALQETTIWLTEMFNALEEAVFLATPTGRIVEANIAAQQIFGYSLDEMKHLTTELLHVDKDHFMAFRTRVRDMLAKGETAVFEYRARRKNGETFPVMIHIAMLKKSITFFSPLNLYEQPCRSASTKDKRQPCLPPMIF